MLDAKGEPYLLEVNTGAGNDRSQPGADGAKGAGIQFDDLVVRILEDAHVDNAAALNRAPIYFTAPPRC